MPQTPPLLPTAKLARVLRVARIDGISILAVAGTLAIVTAINCDVQSTLIGLLVAAAGASELRGVRLLRNGLPEGLRWLIFSQLYLLIVIVGYAIWRLLDFNPVALRAMVSPEVQTLIRDLGISLDSLLATSYRAAYLVIIVATLIYQGGMAFYYWRRSTIVTAALKNNQP